MKSEDDNHQNRVGFSESSSPKQIVRMMSERYKELTSNDINQIHKNLQTENNANELGFVEGKVKERKKNKMSKNVRKFYDNQKVFNILNLLQFQKIIDSFVDADNLISHSDNPYSTLNDSNVQEMVRISDFNYENKYFDLFLYYKTFSNLNNHETQIQHSSIERKFLS